MKCIYSKCIGEHITLGVFNKRCLFGFEYEQGSIEFSFGPIVILLEK